LTISPDVPPLEFSVPTLQPVGLGHFLRKFAVQITDIKRERTNDILLWKINTILILIQFRRNNNCNVSSILISFRYMYVICTATLELLTLPSWMVYA